MIEIQSKRNYESLYFTKPLQHLSLEETVGFVAKLGCDGLDLAVRENYPTTPENVAEALPRVVEAAANKSVKIGMLTVPGEMTSPSDTQLRAIMKACGDSGVPFIKLGYWNYQGYDYWGQVERIKSDLAVLGELAAAAGVCLLIHTHSNTMAHSAALVHNLVDGSDPNHIGVYLDTCHITMRGENLDQAMDIVGNRLKAIAVKDALRIKIDDEMAMEPFHNNMDMKPLGDGVWNLPRFIDALNNRDFQGYLSYHLEYEVDEDEVETSSAHDLDFLRKRNLIK